MKKTTTKKEKTNTMKIMDELIDDVKAYIKKRAKKKGLTTYLYAISMCDINYNTIGSGGQAGKIQSSHGKVLSINLKRQQEKLEGKKGNSFLKMLNNL